MRFPKPVALPAVLSLFVAVACALVVAVPEGLVDSEAQPAAAARHVAPVAAAVTIGVDPTPGIPRIQPGFVGLSLEYPAVQRDTSPGAARPNVMLERLIRNLSPGARPVLRIGGDSTDATWWPRPGRARPRGITYTLTPGWLASTRRLARDLNARVIVGVNLEAHRRRLAIAEARALLGGIGARRIEGVEIGNEPSNYSRFPWHRAGGREVYARPRNYSFADFVREFSAIRAGLPRIPLAGPALGGYGWLSHLGRFLHAEPSVSTVTFHRYPLNRCFAHPGSRMEATLPNLLSPFAARGFLAPVRQSVRLAHARGARFRLDEFNSVSCSGKFGLSDSFASALWVLDALFEAAHDGIDGVNIHTFPGAAYAPFDLRRDGGAWSAVVRPEYYGLLLFARAAPAESALLPVSGGPTPHGLKIWATRGRDGIVRAVLINKNRSAPAHVALRVPGSAGSASVERLVAPGVLAKSGVTLADQRFATPSMNGRLTGSPHVETIQPRDGRYALQLPPVSAVLLTVRAFR